MKKYSIWLSFLIALVGSLVINAILVAVFLPMTGVPSNVMTFHLVGPTGAFTVIGVVGATIVYALMRRFAKNPDKAFIWTAVIVFLLSLLPDIFVHDLGPMFAQITVGGIVLLMALHLSCALITTYALVKCTKPRMINSPRAI